MTSSEEKMLQEAQAALQEGNKKRAKDLLTRLLKQDQENPEYWLLMSAVVDSEKERRYCLNQTIKLDPDNKMARRGLMILGDIPVDESLVIPYEMQKRKWQLPPLIPVESTQKMPLAKIAIASVGLIVAVVLIIVAIRSSKLWTFRGRNLAAIGTAVPTQTYPPSPTATITLTPRIIEPTAPWNILESTYTPTPIYVFTPHPIIEAFSVAMRNYQKEDWTGVINFLNQAIKSEKEAPDLYFHLGEAYLQIGDLPNALSSFDQAIAIDSDFAPGYYGRAKINLANEETRNEAIEDLLTSIKLDPEFGEAYLALIQAYLEDEKLDEAQVYMAELETILPSSPLVDLIKARIALSEGDYNQAIYFAQTALEKDLTLLEAYKLLGEIYQISGNEKASLEPLLIYTRYNTTFDPVSDIFLAKAYAANNDYAEAIKLFDSILKKDSGYYEGYYQRGQLFSQLEEYQKAFDDFEVAFKLHPKSFDYCMTLSEANFPLNKPGNAYQQAGACQKLAKNDTQLAHMFFVRAIALEALKNDVAKRDWERMLELDPDAILPEWKATAAYYLNQYYTATPTLAVTPSPLDNANPTPSLTGTLKPSATITVTPTR